MEGILCVFNSLLIIEGILLVVYSECIREFFHKIYNGFTDKLLALVAFMIGIALLIAAFSASCPAFFIVIAVLIIVKTLFYMLDPKEYFSKITDWFLNNASERVYRFLGVLEVMLGTVAFFFV
jgi:uncharacterized protein YjeT (DUF2065 family)